MAAQTGRRVVETATVERAWADLQQLPTPWNETTADQAAVETIEFGGLDADEPLPAPWVSSDAVPRPAEDAPQTRFEPCFEPDHLASADAQLAALGQQFDYLAEEFEEWGAGETEVELVLDDAATERSEQFEISLSLTPSPAAAIVPQWDSTEFCQNPRPRPEQAEEQTHLPPLYEGEIVNEHGITEEIVVDRYATLDALKRQGKLPRPQSTAGHTSCSGVSAEAEKSLTLAEALVQHATAMEQAGWVGSEPVDGESNEVAAHARFSAGWSSVELTPAGSEQMPEPASEPLDGLTINLEAVENCPEAEESEQPCVAVFQPTIANCPAREEPALIVVEDDPQELTVQVQPQATPVKKQEYRQLFAKLRRS
jgi:hypothetical protein